MAGMWSTLEVGKSVSGYDKLSDLTSTSTTANRVVSSTNGIVSNGDTTGFSSENADNLDKNDFLNLLVTQLKNQDPMSPQDNSAFVSQLAQFSSLETNQAVSTSMKGLSDNMNTFMSLQTVNSSSTVNAAATSLLGKAVRVASDTIKYTGSPVDMKIQMNTAGDTGYVAVKNSAGEVVAYDRIEADKGETTLEYTWDGMTDSDAKATNGTYTVEVLDDSKTSAAGCSYADGTVDGIRYTSDGSRLVINGSNYQLKNLLWIDNQA